MILLVSNAHVKNYVQERNLIYLPYCSNFHQYSFKFVSVDNLVRRIKFVKLFQEEKVYVHHVMSDKGALLWKLLEEEKAWFFIAG